MQPFSNLDLNHFMVSMIKMYNVMLPEGGKKEVNSKMRALKCTSGKSPKITKIY